jgi:ABC-type branched-subunit amino acid transport system ATPase component
MLTCLQIKKYFGGVKAIDGCSFEVKENTITALIGPNGAGKSTVFNIISGITKEDEGKIIFNKEDLTHLSTHKRAQKGIARMFQHTRLFNNLTVKENLFLAFSDDDTKFWKNLSGIYKLTKENEIKIKEMLKMVNMERFENRLTRDLSYGQKRLIELLRTILYPHKLLMLDEPVAGVNPMLREKIAEILKDLKNKGETVLLIEHDMNFTFKIADYVIVMDYGKVIAEGAPEEIKNNPKVLEAYLGNNY